MSSLDPRILLLQAGRNYVSADGVRLKLALKLEYYVSSKAVDHAALPRRFAQCMDDYTWATYSVKLGRLSGCP